jgi:hypothetical protein
MYNGAGDRPPTIYGDRFLAALLVIAIMAGLYWAQVGYWASDWLGYQNLYLGEGSWLSVQGRDPGFIWLLEAGYALFGPEGYETFRLVLFVLFTAFASWLAYSIPTQIRVGPFSMLLTVAVTLCAFLLKGFIQIREGVAFMFVLAPAVVMYGQGRRGIPWSGLGGIVAPLIHAGAALLTAAWFLAMGLFWLGRRALASRLLISALTVSAIGVGALVALEIFRSVGAVEFLRRDIGIGETPWVQAAGWKYAYWALNGLIVMVLRHQILDATNDMDGFPRAYAVSVGAIILPLAYAVCAVLVFGNFNLLAVTSVMIRLLLTSLELAVIIICLRGRGDWLTAGIAAAMLADRARLIIAT